MARRRPLRSARLFAALALVVAGGTAAPAFDPPTIIHVLNPVTDGQPLRGERTYYLDQGTDSQIGAGDVLKVYRAKRGVEGGPPVRFYIGTLRIYHAEKSVAAGHFTVSGALQGDPSIRHHKAMKSDIAIPSMSIEADVLFAAGQIALLPAAAAQFQRAIDFVAKYQPDRLVIIGHTDDTGDAEQAQKLSLARAEAVRLYLIETIAALTPAMVDARGAGNESPLATNDTPENRARNRRLEIIAWD